MAKVIDIKVSKIEARRMVMANIKRENKGKVIILFEDHDVYKAYDEDALTISTYCYHWTVSTNIQVGYTISITKDTIDIYFPRLIKNGYKICVIE